jgi:membrane-bound lytic murein transglycosylase D
MKHATPHQVFWRRGLDPDTIVFSMAKAPVAAWLISAGVLAGAAAPAVASPAPSPRSWPSAAEESTSERRAVRGMPVDDVAESPELRELRRFEEQAFPRGGSPAPARDEGAPPPQLAPPGRWGGSGDVPAELRSPGTSIRPPETPVAPDSDWLRSLKLPELPVRWDPQVLRYLDYFKNDPKGRLVMGNWLRRAGRFRELFERTLERHGLPKDLIYVAMVESGFDTSARSRVGAGGIWQFMPSAARAYGLEISYWVDARRDPERSADAAARYLKDLYVRFGSWYLVFAAYNAGYGAVLKSITTYNTNDFWELIRHEDGLPWESSIYVPKILAAAIIGHNLGVFGYADGPPDPAFAYEEVEAPPGTTLSTAAKAAGTRVEVLEALNPHLIRDRTPPDRGSTRLRIPPGSSAIYAEGLDRSRTPSDRVQTVVLRFGETLDDVAKARGLNARELRKLNGVKDTSELRAGVTILVPRRDKAGAPKDKDEGEALASGKETRGDTPDADDADDDAVIVAVPDRAFSYDGRERVFYKTRDGDDLQDIADTFGVRADELCEWNNLDPSAKLHPRMVLQIFVSKDFDPAGVLLLDPGKVRVVTLGSDEFLELETARRGKKRLFYTAKSGDTLARVGRRYGLTPGDLARINRFSYNTELHEGQRIVVYSPTGEAPREIAMGMKPSDSKRTKTGEVATASATRKLEGSSGKKPAAQPAARRPPQTPTRSGTATKGAPATKGAAAPKGAPLAKSPAAKAAPAAKKR